MADYQLSAECARSLTFAIAVSELRKSVTVEVLDVLGAMYLTNRQDLSKYWQDERAFEELVITKSGVGEAIAAFERIGAKAAFRIASPPGEMQFKRWSLDLIGAVRAARELASLRTPGEPKPILTSEHLLLAVARHTETEVAQTLIRSGLDIEKLERAIAAPGTEDAAG